MQILTIKEFSKFYLTISVVYIYRETCCGTHVHNTSVLQHFCFLTYTSKGATKHTVKAVVGREALRMKQADEKICRRIADLEEALKSGKFINEQFKEEISRIKQEINDSNIQISYSYLIKEKCMTRLENLSKAIWLQEKEIEKYVKSHLFI